MATEIFQTDEPDVVEDIMQSSYGGKMQLDASRRPAAFRLESAPVTAQVRLDQLTTGLGYSLEASPLGVLIIAELRSGHAAYHSGGSERSYGPGDTFISVLPDDPYACRIGDTDFVVAAIDPALPSQVADTAPGRRQQPVKFTGYDPVSPQAARRWAATRAFTLHTVLTQPDLAGQPLLAGSTAQLLVAAALAVFPNNALTDPTIEDRHDAHPETLRRAVAFIDENAQTNITVSDIAAAFVTVRAVQLAFRTHLDMTPMEYLRRVRLDHAHHDLLAADPARTTITAVAYRWGFPSTSRFSAYYRQAYGVTPSHTLRT